MMNEVKRFDNQLLALSIAIRQCIKNKDFKHSPIKIDNDGNEGIFRMSRTRALKEFRGKDLQFWRHNKIGSWRNKTVNEYNGLVRESLGFKDKFCVGDLLLSGQPITVNRVVKAFTDEELQVAEVVPTTFTVFDHKIKTDVLTIVDRDFKLSVPKDVDTYQTLLARLAADARSAPKRDRSEAWSKFWHVKDKFHLVRYGYAMTSHRLQGSTLDSIYIDEKDVLSNPEKVEAFRSLYVLATRPKTRLTAF
jgi:hypothetical protein